MDGFDAIVLRVQAWEVVRRGSEAVRNRIRYRGEFYAARRLIRVLTNSLDVLEHEDAEIVRGLDDMAGLLAERGQLRRARVANSRAVARLLAWLGPEDPLTLRALARRASLLAQSGDDAGAVNLASRVLADCRRELGDSASLTLDVAAGLGSSHARLKEFSLARELHEEASEGRLRLLGAGHPVVDALTDLYMTEIAVGDRAAAERTRSELEEARQAWWRVRMAGVDLILGVGRFLAGNVEEMKARQQLDAAAETGAVAFPRRAWLTD